MTFQLKLNLNFPIKDSSLIKIVSASYFGLWTKNIPKNKKLFLGIKSGAKGSEVELFLERCRIILNPTVLKT